MAIASKIALRAFDALSHEARLKIFRSLVKSGSKGLTASNLCEMMEMPAATLSFHMSKLQNGELVEATKNGRSVTYIAEYQAVNDLVEYLSEKCCAETAESCNIKKCT